MQDPDSTLSPLLRQAVTRLLEEAGFSVLGLSRRGETLEVSVPDGVLQLALSPGAEGVDALDGLAPPGRLRESRAVYDAPPARLTQREQDVARLLAQGASNEAISHQLGIQAQSVRNLVSAVMRKLGCSNRIQIAIKWREGQR